MIDETILICLFVLVTGACIGSFLNVVALRALSGESIVFPASKCPLCNEPIKWYDNLPILSYLLTFRGKCRNCGGKVSVQYPIVEALTSILFLLVFLFFGFSLQTLFLLIMICISIVIGITDFRKECIYDVHSWILIISAIATSLAMNGLENYSRPAIGLIVGVVIMEAIAKLSYYLIKKEEPQEEATEQQEQIEENKTEEQTENKEEVVEKSEEQEETTENKEEEEIDINEYVKQNKRAFGEGDTYLAAAAGALLGWQYLIIAIALAIMIQAVCILPQFLIGLYKQNEKRLLFSLSAFVIIAILYWMLSNAFNLHLYVIFAFLIALIFFAIDSITRLKKTVNQQGFVSLPFGPALLFSMFATLFFGTPIVIFLLKHIFMFAE